MPTPFRRVAVIVSPDEEHLLERLGALQGRSKASYLRHLLEVATPALRRLESSLRGVETVQARLDDNINDAIEHMQADLDQQLDMVWDDALGDDPGPMDAGAAGGATAAPAPFDPRMVTRGSKPQRGRKSPPKAVAGGSAK